jgi:GTP 3',8-cyclase
LGIPVKINTVLIRGINDNEIETLLEWANTHNFVVRFIEFMPLVSNKVWQKEKVVTEQEVIDILKKRHTIELLSSSLDSPAKLYLVDKKFKIGFISTVSQPFCNYCDRIRLTSDGKIVRCLFDTFPLDIKKSLRSANLDQVKEIIANAWKTKPAGFIALKEHFMSKLPMYQVGG